jgi:hypothetical protein
LIQIGLEVAGAGTSDRRCFEKGPPFLTSLDLLNPVQRRDAKRFCGADKKLVAGVCARIWRATRAKLLPARILIARRASKEASKDKDSWLRDGL